MAEQQRRFEPTVASVRVLPKRYAVSRRFELGSDFGGSRINLKWMTSTMLFESDCSESQPLLNVR